MNLINMQLPREEREDHDAICCDAGDAPRYPYGLCLQLDDKTLEKLGISTLPQVGTELVLMARVKVTTTGQYETQEGSDNNVSLQITDMALDGGQRPDPAKALYGQ